MYAAEKVRKFTEKIFIALGCSIQDAKLSADVLINADLCGVDSHGVARLAGYVRLYDNGRLNPKPFISIYNSSTG